MNPANPARTKPLSLPSSPLGETALPSGGFARFPPPIEAFNRTAKPIFEKLSSRLKELMRQYPIKAADLDNLFLDFLCGEATLKECGAAVDDLEGMHHFASQTFVLIEGRTLYPFTPPLVMEICAAFVECARYSVASENAADWQALGKAHATMKWEMLYGTGSQFSPKKSKDFFRETLPEFSSPSTVGPVLEIGAGPHLASYFQGMNRRLHLVVAERHPFVVGFLEEFARRSGLSGISISGKPFSFADYEPDSFGVIRVKGSFNYIPHLLSDPKQIWQLLRPGGVLLLQGEQHQDDFFAKMDELCQAMQGIPFVRKDTTEPNRMACYSSRLQKSADALTP